MLRLIGFLKQLYYRVHFKNYFGFDPIIAQRGEPFVGPEFKTLLVFKAVELQERLSFLRSTKAEWERQKAHWDEAPKKDADFEESYIRRSRRCQEGIALCEMLIEKHLKDMRWADKLMHSCGYQGTVFDEYNTIVELG